MLMVILCSIGDGYYMGDKTIAECAQKPRRAFGTFLERAGQKKYSLSELRRSLRLQWRKSYPNLTETNAERGYNTGYALRKGGSFNQKHYRNGGGYTAAICYRATEALLNYMEAYYELHGNRGGNVDKYWNKLRQRAGITGTIDQTIAATDMSEEAKNDWGAYFAGDVMTDKTLYNIRRERRW